jgi:hypothetical protein
MAGTLNEDVPQDKQSGATATTTSVLARHFGAFTGRANVVGSQCVDGLVVHRAAVVQFW